ncbi:MAG: putative peptidoglycan glycosyltransferase FtsW [Candidatus Kapabacteria bacterium]|jgi:cell division protein FtsW|nr:putative peptidoglycan glycosyltransferase FtsW [Candidatus Kapabacteria bacterium]
MKNEKSKIDWYILISVSALMLFGLAFVYSASAPFSEFKTGSTETFFMKHLWKVLFAIVLMFVFAKVDYHIWKKFSKPIMIIALIFLGAVLIFGEEVNHATRWLDLKIIVFQPSELARFALVIHLAVLLARDQDKIKDWKKGLKPILVFPGLIIVLIVLQPNFSTAFVILFFTISMIFIGNANLKHIAVIGVSSLAAGAIAIAYKGDYVLKRIVAFANELAMTFGGGTEADSVNSFVQYGYQQEQSLLALGNGGLFGVGAGASRQSDLFLPESYGDFIFSIIGEEYGFVGVALILMTFMFIFWRGMLVAKRSPDNFGYFLSFGILASLAISVFVNAGVNSALLPPTGQPMSFISYGGTALWLNSIAIGILLNISAQSGIYPNESGNPFKSK